MPLGYSVYGEVRLMSKEKTGGHFNKRKGRIVGATRKQRGRLDIAVFWGSKMLCAVEVKNKKTAGWKGQKKKYLGLGVPRVFLCSSLKQIDSVGLEIKEFISEVNSGSASQ